MLIPILIFLISIALLIKGSDLFIDAAENCANIVGMATAALSVTFIAFATSLPELGTAIAAAAIGNSGIVIGDIIGSNIANIGLVLGISAMFIVAKQRKLEFIQEAKYLVGITIIFFILSLDGVLEWTDGLLMLLLFAIYLYKFISAGKSQADPQPLAVARTEKQKLERRKELQKWIAIGVIGIGTVFIGAKFVVSSLLDISRSLGVSEQILSMVLIGIGTSLPELAVSITAIKKGLKTIAFGNIIGSNITNILAVGGVAALITPLTVTTSDIMIYIPFLFVLTLLLYRLVKSEKWFSRVIEGALLLLFYVIFLFFLGIQTL